MEFKDIMAISGKPGLFKFVAQGRNAVIVENLETGKRFSAFTSDRISSFEEISVFTNDGDVQLSEIFKIMTDKLDGKQAPSTGSAPDELKKFFQEILPDFDQSRVYVSDIKKIISWFTILNNLDLMGDLLKKMEEKEDKNEDKKEEDVAQKEDASEPEKKGAKEATSKKETETGNKSGKKAEKKS